MEKYKGNIGLVILLTLATILIIAVTYGLLNTQAKREILPNTRSESPSVSTNPNAEWKIYNNKKYAYTLSFPVDWQLNEEILIKQNNNIDTKLNNGNNTGSIFLTAAPAGRGCFFMQGPNPNLMPRAFKIGDKSITLEDDCFEKTYGISLKNKTGDKLWLEIVAKNDNSYQTIYAILDSLQGLRLAE